MAIFAYNLCLSIHSSSFRASPCSSSSLKTHVKSSCHIQSAGMANRGLKSLPSHHFDRSTSASTITEAGAQTQRWNTKTSETTSIIDVQRYLKELNGQDLNNRERGGMSLGSKSLGNKFYDNQKGTFHIGKMVMIL